LPERSGAHTQLCGSGRYQPSMSGLLRVHALSWLTGTIGRILFGRSSIERAGERSGSQFGCPSAIAVARQTLCLAGFRAHEG
jgi:hypothetical protein